MGCWYQEEPVTLPTLFAVVEWGSTKTGEQDGLIGTAMNCVLQVPKYLPQEQRFDIRVLVSGSDWVGLEPAVPYVSGFSRFLMNIILLYKREL